MIVKILELKPRWTLIEYDDVDGMIQRKLLPRILSGNGSSEVGDIVDIGQELLGLGVDAGNIDLTTVLGPQLPSVPTSVVLDMLSQAGLWQGSTSSESVLPELDTLRLQDRFRRNGLWVWRDYKENPESVLETLEELIV